MAMREEVEPTRNSGYGFQKSFKQQPRPGSRLSEIEIPHNMSQSNLRDDRLTPNRYVAVQNTIQNSAEKTKRMMLKMKKPSMTGIKKKELLRRISRSTDISVQPRRRADSNDSRTVVRNQIQILKKHSSKAKRSPPRNPYKEITHHRKSRSQNKF